MTLAGTIGLLLCAVFVAGTLALALYRLFAPIFSSSRCPACGGLGSRRVPAEAGLSVRYRCPECAGTGTLAAIVPDRLPSDW